jgi:methionyl-tRNA formyltransferase
MNYQNKSNFIVAGQHSWSKIVFDSLVKNVGNWHFISKESELTPAKIQELQPRYIFFVHWSLKVPKSILEKSECVCFHMTDVPYGRGGSPLQNLIIRGHKETKISALRMVEEFDAGPVYTKKPLSLEGSAQEIFLRASKIIPTMIDEISGTNPIPEPQTGNPVIFKRRTPMESRIQGIENLDKFYDFIRMLDAEDYPKAFLEHEKFHMEFSDASLKDGTITASIKITKKEEPK